MGENKPPLKNELYRPLFERREEIRLEVNKLMREYKALEDIITEHIKLKDAEEKRLAKKAKKQREEEDYEK